MRSSLEHFERVSDYVSGNMSEAERSLFELDMRNDPDLKQQVEFQKDMVRIVERKALRAEIGAVAAQYAAAGGMSLLTKLLLSTGAIATVAVITFFLLNRSNVKQKQPGSQPQIAHLQQTKVPEAKPVTTGNSVATLKKNVRTVKKPVSLSQWILQSRDNSNRPFIVADPVSPNESRITTFYPISQDSIMRELVEERIADETKVKKSTYTASWSISSLKRSVFKRSTAGQKAALRSTAVVKIADLEGSPINGARMTYTLFGETKTVTVDGTYAFKLYQDIRTNVVVEFGNNERVILESVEFSPRRTTFLQVETVLSDTKQLKIEH